MASVNAKNLGDMREDVFFLGIFYFQRMFSVGPRALRYIFDSRGVIFFNFLFF